VNESLSVWHLVANASVVVQIVMALLLAAAFMAWIIIFQRLQVLRVARRHMTEFEERFWSGMDLNRLYRDLQQEPPEFGVETIFMAGFRDFTRLRQQTSDPEHIMDGVQRSMRVAVRRESDFLDNHLVFLATVGSTSPYVGLFGTVWGIMHAFMGLAAVKQVDINSVAPGIAEALIATAIGLFAAIPAVIFYNRLSNKADKLVTQYETFTEEFSSILSRQLHRAPAHAPYHTQAKSDVETTAISGD
jgi:biopolymer transport protein TolQ